MDWKALSEESEAVYLKQSQEDWAKRHRHTQEYCNFTLIRPMWIWNWWHLLRASFLWLGHDAGHVCSDISLQHKLEEFRSVGNQGFFRRQGFQAGFHQGIRSWDDCTLEISFAHQAKLTQSVGPLCSLWALSTWCALQAPHDPDHALVIARFFADPLLRCRLGDSNYDERERRSWNPCQPTKCWSMMAFDLHQAHQDSFCSSCNLYKTWPFVCSSFEAALPFNFEHPSCANVPMQTLPPWENLMGRLRRIQLQLFFPLPNVPGGFQANSGRSKRPGLTGKMLSPATLMAQRAGLCPQIMCAIYIRHAASLKFDCAFIGRLRHLLF